MTESFLLPHRHTRAAACHNLRRHSCEPNLNSQHNNHKIPYLSGVKQISHNLPRHSHHHGILRRTLHLTSHHPSPTAPITNMLTNHQQPYTLYALSTSAWGTLQSLPLLFAPRLIVSLCSTDTDARRTTDLESYLCRTLGLTLLALAASNLIFTGVIPIGPQAPPS